MLKITAESVLWCIPNKIEKKIYQNKETLKHIDNFPAKNIEFSTRILFAKEKIAPKKWGQSENIYTDSLKTHIQYWCILAKKLLDTKSNALKYRLHTYKFSAS